MKLRNYHAFSVYVTEHTIPPRWEIPAHVRRVWARNENGARTAAIRYAHRDANVPPLRSLMRLSWPYTSATREKEYT